MSSTSSRLRMAKSGSSGGPTASAVNARACAYHFMDRATLETRRTGTASLIHPSSICWLMMVTSRLGSDGIQDVRLDRSDAEAADVVHVLEPDTLAFVGVELLERAPVSTPEQGRTPGLECRDRVLARRGCDPRILDSALVQEADEGWRVADPVPGVESLVEVGPNRADRVPERGGRRLEEAGTPRGDGEPAARPDEAPERTD